MAGRKVFAPATVLTAADVNNFLMDQAVMVFADSAARGSGIPAPTEGMVTYLEDTNLLEVFTGASFVEVGPPSPITTEGDLIIGDASGDPVRLAVGAADTVLTSDGTTLSFAAPAAPGMTLLSTTTASGASTSITNLAQTFSKLIFVGEKILASTDTSIRCKIGSGTTYWAGAGADGYAATTFVDSSNSKIGDIGTGGAGTSFYFEVFNYTSTTSRPPIIGAICTKNDEDVFTLAGMRFTLSTINQVQISLATGTFDSGTLSVFGANS